jgi:prepilin-type N-terminal cleavage/methylation domain-containing protein
MRTSIPAGRRPHGFTLVELITVVAILGILVTLTVGAVQGVRNNAARKATEEIFSALDAALQRYYDDWGKYPYTSTTGDFGLVDKTQEEYKFLADTTFATQMKADATLFAALTINRRRGPYFRGGAAQAKIFKTKETGGKTYRAFADGWGREILYVPGGTITNPPRLESLGVNDDPTALTDNMRNWH